MNSDEKCIGKLITVTYDWKLSFNFANFISFPHRC